MTYLGIDEDTTLKNLLCLINPKNKLLKIKRISETSGQFNSMADQSDADMATPS